VPDGLADRLVELLHSQPAVTNLVRLPGAALEPAGDLVLCDVAREAASYVIGAVQDLVGAGRCAIAAEEIDTSLSPGADEAEQAAPGSPVDAVVWEEVEARTSEESSLSVTFLIMFVVAVLIAAIGVLLDSPVLIIGAMVVGPEFGPLAGLAVAIVERRADAARKSLAALAVGFPVAIAASLAFVGAIRLLGPLPESYSEGPGPPTAFISHPNWYSVIVALLAGVAGMLSLTTTKSSALVGVLISVTTVPAAANVGVAAAVGRWDECLGAAIQVAVNLASLLLAGVATLTIQRQLWHRRRRVNQANAAQDRHSLGQR
jgi:uncharacterized hydrophobic protein (TIGR00271 family)